MPLTLDHPASFANADVEDVDKFNKLDFYFADNEARMFPQWIQYGQLFGTLKWRPNQGPVIRGVRSDFSPTGRAFFFPNNITALSNKDIYETFEITEDSRVKKHRHESRQINFLPSFQDFRENQLDHNHKDMVMHIQSSDDMFIRTNMWYRSPGLIRAGASAAAGGSFIDNAPIADGNAANTAVNSKNLDYMLNQVIPNITEPLGLKLLDNATNILRYDLQAPFFEGGENTPKPNKLLQGRYCLVGSGEPLSAMKWDSDGQSLKSDQQEWIYGNMTGNFWNKMTWKIERFPLRFGTDGVFPAPEITDSNNRTVVNPAWRDAPFEIAFLCGADGYKTMPIGPPPGEFTGKDTDEQRFSSLRWNGEVSITDNFLIQYSDSSYDTNRYGEHLKLQSQLTHAILPSEPRNVVPIIYLRRRAGEFV